MGVALRPGAVNGRGSLERGGELPHRGGWIIPIGIAIGVLVVAQGIASPLQERSGQLTADRPFFKAGFETGTLGRWHNLDLGSGTVPTETAPRGGTSPGVVRPTNAVAATGRYAVELTVTPTAHASPAEGWDSVYLWNRVIDSLGNDGQETWERFKVRFPKPPSSRGLTSRPVFTPSPRCEAGCPWFVEHHNDDAYLPFVDAGRITSEYPSLVWSVVTSSRLRNRKLGPQLGMRIWGGDNNTPAEPYRSKPVWVLTREPLRYDHWYDFIVHVRWSADPSVGLVEWWLDGEPIYAGSTSTLWRRPDGSVSKANFELVNYRPHAKTTSTIYFDDIRLGPTAASVAG